MGSSPRQLWWEQTLDLEEARASAMAEADVVSDDKEKERSSRIYRGNK